VIDLEGGFRRLERLLFMSLDEIDELARRIAKERGDSDEIDNPDEEPGGTSETPGEGGPGDNGTAGGAPTKTEGEKDVRAKPGNGNRNTSASTKTATKTATMTVGPISGPGGNEMVRVVATFTDRLTALQYHVGRPVTIELEVPSFAAPNTMTVPAVITKLKWVNKIPVSITVRTTNSTWLSASNGVEAVAIEPREVFTFKGWA
jgi:hypothetical protein